MQGRWLIRAAVVVGTLALLGGLALLGLRTYVRAEVQRRYAERGIQLLPGGVKLGLLYVELESSTFQTQSRPAVNGSIGTLRVEFEGLSAQRVIVSNVVAKGHFTRSDLRAWVQRTEGREEPEHGPLNESLQVRGEHLSLALSEPTGSVPWLSLQDMSFEQRGTNITFDVPSATLLGVSLGNLLGELSSERWVLRNKPSPGDGSFQATASLGPEEITLDAQFASLRLARLLDGSAELASLAVSGAAHARFQRQVAGQPTGDVELTLEGMKAAKLGALGVGFFAERGLMRASWTLDPAYESVKFPVISLRAGKLGLSGSGRLEGLAQEPRIVAALAGSLSCQEISSAFLNAQLGSWLGGLAAAPARQWIKGRVQVDLKLDSKLSSLTTESPHVTLGVGCGLAFPQAALR